MGGGCTEEAIAPDVADVFVLFERHCRGGEVWGSRRWGCMGVAALWDLQL